MGIPTTGSRCRSDKRVVAALLASKYSHGKQHSCYCHSGVEGVTIPPETACVGTVVRLLAADSYRSFTGYGMNVSENLPLVLSPP